jgi:glutathione reductase (NADPH)
MIFGRAYFISPNQLMVAGDETTVYEAPKIVIATGSRADQLDIPGGREFSIDSDGFFQLEELPAKVAVVGAGYIAVELAGVLNGLGSQVHLFIRYDRPLRNFDSSLSQCLLEALTASGVQVHKHSHLRELNKNPGSDELSLSATVGGELIKMDGLSCVIHAIGRSPNVEGLQLEKANVRVGPETKLIVTDEYQNTSQPGVYALGDVCGPLYLTPGTNHSVQYLME